jgi:hypothetical protein
VGCSWPRHWSRLLLHCQPTRVQQRVLLRPPLQQQAVHLLLLLLRLLVVLLQPCSAAAWPALPA